MMTLSAIDTVGTDVPFPPVEVPAGVPMRRWSDGAGGPATADSAAPWTMSQQWPSLVATLSEQCVDSSNMLLNAIDFLAGSGRLRPVEAKTLNAVLYSLRETSLRAQQITRLSTGRVRHTSDRIDLAWIVRDVLAGREDDFRARKVSVSADLKPVDVLLAPPVAVTMINTVIDWALSFSKEVRFTLETPTWPEPARLVANVVTPRPAQRDTAQGAPQPRGRRANDGLHWMLLRQMAASANLTVRRTGGNGQAVLTMEFPKTFNNAEGISSLELFEANDAGGRSLLDAWVLVVVEDPSLRAAALQCLKMTGISAKAAADVTDARLAVTGAPPDAIVVSTESMTPHFQAYRAELNTDGHRCPLVELTEQRPSFNASGFDGFEVAKVGRGQLGKELAPAVLFELAKAL